jgi:hypothetical protein
LNFKALLYKSQRFAVENSPTILAAIAVGGTITTAYLTGKATFKAAEILADEQQARDIRSASAAPGVEDLLTPQEKFEKVWKLYLPAVTTGLLTCTCIVGANRIGTRRTLAMAAAYTLSETRMSEYQAKVAEKFGETKSQQVQDAVAQDHFNRIQKENNGVPVVVGSGEVLCVDGMTGRLFKSSMEEIMRAENEVNRQMIYADSATVSDLYHELGLEETELSGVLGWNVDNKLTIVVTGVVTEDDKPALYMDVSPKPFPDPHKRDKFRS